MSKALKETTPITMELPIGVDRSAALDDFTVNFVTTHQETDLAPALAGLPGGMCHCPHWGVLTKGRMTVTYTDRVEVIEAGEAFYMPPGHTPATDAGTEFTMFSPSAELAVTEAAIAKAMEGASA